MHWQGVCTNQDCKKPSKFTVPDATPATVAILTCNSCKASYRFILKSEGSIEFGPYKTGLDVHPEPEHANLSSEFNRSN
jgi:hypothetical protein